MLHRLVAAALCVLVGAAPADALVRRAAAAKKPIRGRAEWRCIEISRLLLCFVLSAA